MIVKSYDIELLCQLKNTKGEKLFEVSVISACSSGGILQNGKFVSYCVVDVWSLSLADYRVWVSGWQFFFFFVMDQRVKITGYQLCSHGYSSLITTG
jgi:hypothetical protein